MINKKLLLLIFMLTSVMFSQETIQNFSLQQAIDYALENNRTAKNATRDINAAYKQKWEVIADGLPQINGSVDYQNFIEQQVQVFPESFGGGSGAFGLKQNVNASITISQLIFDGTYLVGLQSAKVFLEISKNAKIKTDLEVRKALINAYGNVLLAEESIRILESNKKTIEKNLNEITKIYENGLAEEESVEQLKITLSGIKSSLGKTQRLKEIAYQMLNINLGLNIEDNIVLTDNLETLTIQNINLDFFSSELSAENTIDYEISRNNKTSKALLLKLERSRFLPTLSTFLSGGYVSYSNNFTFLDSDQKYYDYGLFGVSLKLPIFSSGLSGSRIKYAKINLEKATDDLTETKQRLKLEINSAKSDYQFSIEDYANKKENLKLAERIEQKSQTKFFEGISSGFDLRQAQIQLYKAQQELLQTMLDVINNKAALETISNSINN